MLVIRAKKKIVKRSISTNSRSVHSQTLNTTIRCNDKRILVGEKNIYVAIFIVFFDIMPFKRVNYYI